MGPESESVDATGAEAQPESVVADPPVETPPATDAQATAGETPGADGDAAGNVSVGTGEGNGDEEVVISKAEYDRIMKRLDDAAAAQRAGGQQQAKPAASDGGTPPAPAAQPSKAPQPPGYPKPFQSLKEFEDTFSDHESFNAWREQEREATETSVTANVVKRVADGIEAQTMGLNAMWRIFDKVPEMKAYRNIVQTAIDEAMLDPKNDNPFDVAEAAIEICKRDVLAFGQFKGGRNIDGRPAAKPKAAAGTKTGPTSFGGDNNKNPAQPAQRPFGGSLSARMLGLTGKR